MSGSWIFWKQVTQLKLYKRKATFGAKTDPRTILDGGDWPYFISKTKAIYFQIVLFHRALIWYQPRNPKDPKPMAIICFESI